MQDIRKNAGRRLARMGGPFAMCNISRTNDARLTPYFAHETCTNAAIFGARMPPYFAHFSRTFGAMVFLPFLKYHRAQAKGKGRLFVSDVVIVAIVGAIGSGLCSLLGVLASSKLTQYRLQQLEAKVQAHNNLIDRMYKVERKQELLERHVEDLHRHDE